MYYSSVAPSVELAMPVTYNLAKLKSVVRLGAATSTIQTVGGVAITVFSSESHSSSDAYATMIAPHYDADVYAETWLFGT